MSETKDYKISGLVQRTIVQTKHISIDHAAESDADVREWAADHAKSELYHNLSDFNEWGEVRIESTFKTEPRVEEVDENGKAKRTLTEGDAGTTFETRKKEELRGATQAEDKTEPRPREDAQFGHDVHQAKTAPKKEESRTTQTHSKPSNK